MDRKLFVELKSDRIILKPRTVDMDEVKAICYLINKNRAFLSRWLKWALLPQEIEDVLQASYKFKEKWDNMTSATYGIVDVDSKKIMGMIELRNIDYDVCCGEIGYWLAEEFNGHGYMSEAVNLLEDEFFKRGMERIFIRCDDRNVASAAVAERTGHKLEGILRHCNWDTTHTMFIDERVYSKLYSEWQK